MIDFSGKQTAAVLLCAAYSVVATLIILKAGGCQAKLTVAAIVLFQKCILSHLEAISMFMPLKPRSLHVDLHERPGLEGHADSELPATDCYCWKPLVRHHEKAYHSPIRAYVASDLAAKLQEPADAESGGDSSASESA